MSQTPNTTLTRRALEIATAAHASQFRKDGKPYISHPIAVAEIAMGLIKTSAPYWMRTDVWREWVTVLSYWHDAEEDVKGFSAAAMVAQLQDEGLITPNQATALVADLSLLNKRNSATYAEYISRLKHEQFKNNLAARIVKRSDLTHNLSDLPPGHQRDKYELALHILES